MTTLSQDYQMWAAVIRGHISLTLQLWNFLDTYVNEEFINGEQPSNEIIKLWLLGAERLGFKREVPDNDDSYFDAAIFDTPKGRFTAPEKVILTQDTVFHIYGDETYRTTFNAGDYAKLVGYQDGRYSLAITDPWGWIATVDGDFFRKADDES